MKIDKKQVAVSSAGQTLNCGLMQSQLLFYQHPELFLIPHRPSRPSKHEYILSKINLQANIMKHCKYFRNNIRTC